MAIHPLSWPLEIFLMAQKRNPQIWRQSEKSETHRHINCFTRRYFFWWSVSESCDLKWPGRVFWVSVFSADQTRHRFGNTRSWTNTELLTKSRFHVFCWSDEQIWEKQEIGFDLFHKTEITRHWRRSNWFQIVRWWDFNRLSVIHKATHSLLTLNSVYISVYMHMFLVINILLSNSMLQNV